MTPRELSLTTLKALTKHPNASILHQDAEHLLAEIPTDALADLCEGHFPGEPIVPGAHLLGLMVDLAEVFVSGSFQLRPVGCTFKAVIRPDQAAQIGVRWANRSMVHAKVRVPDTPGVAAAAKIEVRGSESNS